MRILVLAAFVATLSTPSIADPILKCQVSSWKLYQSPRVTNIIRAFNGPTGFKNSPWIDMCKNGDKKCHNDLVFDLGVNGVRRTSMTYSYTSTIPGTSNHVEEQKVHIDRESGKFSFSKMSVLRKEGHDADGQPTSGETYEGTCRVHKVKQVL